MPERYHRYTRFAGQLPVEYEASYGFSKPQHINSGVGLLVHQICNLERLRACTHIRITEITREKLVLRSWIAEVEHIHKSVNVPPNDQRMGECYDIFYKNAMRVPNPDPPKGRNHGIYEEDTHLRLMESYYV